METEERCSRLHVIVLVQLKAEKNPCKFPVVYREPRFRSRISCNCKGGAAADAVLAKRTREITILRTAFLPNEPKD
jgi:hypothetical protein